MAARPDPSVSLPGRYRVLRHLADGGMASVWEAEDELLGRRVAVKVLAPGVDGDDAARRRFTREGRAAAKLSVHPNVVTVHDAGEHDGHAFLVMALYTGGSVAGRLATGPVPRATALDWLEDAAAGLDAAHAEGLVHRDVKPANLLLDARDDVAVADFGIATAAGEASMTSTGLVLGTLAYLAPEQRTGGVATAASDRYALGLVARQLLTGAKPGQAPAQALPASANAVLTRATAEDAAARFPSCAAFVGELEAALGVGGDADATAATRAVPLARPRARAAALPPVGGAPEEHTAAAPVVRVPPGSPTDPGGTRTDDIRPVPGVGPARAGSGRLLAALAATALLVAVVAVALASRGGEDTGGRTASTSSSTAKRTPRTSSSTTGDTQAPAASTSTPAAPAPAASTPSTSTPAATARKSRAALIAQNNAAYAATKGDPAGQVAPLQEAVDGLCTTQDVQCAFALFNLARALRLAGRPAEAVPLLERRLGFSDNQVGTVRAELAAAQAAAGGGTGAGGDAAAGGNGNGKAKGKDKGGKGDG